MSAVITRFNVAWFCMQHCSDRSRIYIRIWIHETHPISRPANGRAMGCLQSAFCILEKNTNRVITALHWGLHDLFTNSALWWHAYFCSTEILGEWCDGVDVHVGQWSWYQMWGGAWRWGWLQINPFRTEYSLGNMYIYIYIFSTCHRHWNVTGCRHDDVIKWNHFPRYSPFVGGIHRSSRSFDVFFDLRLNKRLRKQLYGCRFETPAWPLWCHCNDIHFEGRQRDIHTTGKNREYLESLRGTLVFNTLICWKSLVTNHKQVLWLWYNFHV